MSRLRALSLCALMSLPTGCVGFVASGTVVVHDPYLIEVAPGVWVVEDYPSAVYYVNNYYWYWDSGIWYRSAYFGGGWAVIAVDVVPVSIVRIPHSRYRNYRSSTSRRRVVPHAQRYHTPPDSRQRNATQRGRSQQRPSNRNSGNNRGRGHGRGRGHK